MTDQGGRIPPLPRRRRLLADLSIAHPDWTDADIAAAAGYTPAGAASARKTKAVQLYIQDHLDRAGATREKAARVIFDAHEATITREFAYKGDVTEGAERVDHPVRLSAATLNLKLRGDLKPDAVVQVNQYTGLSDEQVAMIADGRAAMNDFIDVKPDAGTI